jgi:hypothetical protein
MHGRPSAVMVGVEREDLEIAALETSAPFRKAIGDRRGQKTVTLSKARRRLKV